MSASQPISSPEKEIRRFPSSPFIPCKAWLPSPRRHPESQGAPPGQVHQDLPPATTTLASSPPAHTAPPISTPSPTPASPPSPGRCPPGSRRRLGPVQTSLVLPAVPQLAGDTTRLLSQAASGTRRQGRRKKRRVKKFRPLHRFFPGLSPQSLRNPGPTRRQRLKLFPKTHTCLPAGSRVTARARVSEAAPIGTRDNGRCPRTCPRLRLETSPKVCGGGALSTVRRTPVPSSARGELAPENRRPVCPLVLYPAVLRPQLPGLAGPGSRGF